jgi:hypothetical protein
MIAPASRSFPVVLKDNYNTADLPTTGGSVLPEGSIPPADAFVVIIETDIGRPFQRCAGRRASDPASLVRASRLASLLQVHVLGEI